MNIGKIALALSQFPELYSARVNEFVMHVGNFGNSSFNLVYMEIDKPNKLHYHPHSTSTFFIFQGEGLCLNGDVWLDYHPGDVIVVQPGVKHQIYPKTNTLFLSTQNPQHHFTDQGWTNTVEIEE